MAEYPVMTTAVASNNVESSGNAILSPSDAVWDLGEENVNNSCANTALHDSAASHSDTSSTQTDDGEFDEENSMTAPSQSSQDDTNLQASIQRPFYDAADEQERQMFDEESTVEEDMDTMITMVTTDITPGYNRQVGSFSPQRRVEKEGCETPKIES
eukprot:2634378-Ditylum_brightwellii.AAC.2